MYYPLANTYKSSELRYHLFFFLIISVIFILKVIQYDYTYFTDQDHVHVFEALVFNSGKVQTYYDHPGFICFVILGLWFQILELFGLISFSDLDYNQFNLSDLNKLIFYTRVLNLFIAFAIYYFINKFVNFFINNKKYSFFLILIFILSGSYYGILVRVRTEIYSILFYLIFLDLVFNFLQNYKLKKIFLAGCAITLAISAKVQILILLVFTPIILILLPFKKVKYNLSLNKFPIFILLIITLVGLNFHLSIFKNLNYFYKDIFIPFSYFYFFLFVLFSSLAIQKFQIFENLKFFNLNLLIYSLLLVSGVYFVIILMLFLKYTSFETIFVILTPLEKLYSFSRGSDKIIFSISNSLNNEILFLFKSLDFQEVIILCFIFFGFLYESFKTKKLKKYFILPIWFAIKIILTFRYGQYVPSFYYIYSYFFLFLLFIIIFSDIDFIKLKTISLIICVFVSLYNFGYKVYFVIDKDRSELNFCEYKDEISWDNYFSNYYCE